MAAEVPQLGAALLAALEKRDAEALAQLRAGQELALLQLVTRREAAPGRRGPGQRRRAHRGAAVVGGASRRTTHSRPYMNAGETHGAAMSWRRR